MGMSKTPDMKVYVGADPATLASAGTKKELQAALYRIKDLKVNVSAELHDIETFKSKLQELCAPRTININIAGDLDEQIKKFEERMQKIQELSVSSANTSSTVKTSTTSTVDAELSTSIYKEIQNLIATINSLKEEGIKFDQEAAEAAQIQNRENKENLALLGKIRSEYLKVYAAQQKLGDDKTSESYQNTVKALEEIEKQMRQVESNSGIDQSVIDSHRSLLESAKQRIDYEQKAAKAAKEANSTKLYERQVASVEKYSKSISKMSDELELMKKQMKDTSLDTQFDKAAAKIAEFQARYQSIKSTIDQNEDHGTTSDLTDDVAKMEELKNEAEEVYNTIKKTNTERAAGAKDADKLNQLSSEVVAYMNDYGSELRKNQELYQRLITLQNKLANGTIGLSDAKKEFAEIRMEARKLGVEVDNIWKKLARAFQARGRGLLSNEGWMLISIAMRDVVRNVIDLDSAMTELKKVTTATAAEYDAFLDTAADRAKSIGATLVDTVSATSDFARLGYDIPDASNLADSALIYLNVGDDVDDITQASESIISTMQGFNIEAEKSIDIVDKFNEVANNYASSAGDIGEITKRSAAAMKVAGSDINETIALGVTANEVVQDAASIGTALKTMSMRLRSSETELEEAGIDTDGMAESVSKLRSEILALSGVDIMLDDETFKTPYQMLTELGKVWDDLTDVGRANIGELLFGKRQTGNCLGVWKQAS